MTYADVHHELRRQRGPASNYLCVGCGEQAQHWAYMYNGDPEIARTATRGPCAEDVHNCYQPMCVACHRKHDFEKDEWVRRSYQERAPLDSEFRRAQGEHMGRTHAERLKNNPAYAEQHREYSRRNARARRKCDECGLESHPPGVARHQKASGHKGRTDL